MSIRRPAAFNLVGLRTIRWRDLRLFLINIFLISFLFTITVSIFLGIGRTEPFVSETENTAVLTEPGKEALFSKVPTYLVEDLLKLEGVTAVSPETLDLCYQADKNRPVFVRGVTDEFPKVLDKYRIISGRWINFTSASLEGVAGKRYSEKLGIITGKSILLVSRRTDLVLSIKIVGIIESDSNADDSILLPLWAGQILSNYPTTDVNLMRIRFDPTITSHKTIRGMVNEDFQIVVKTGRYNSTAFDPLDTQVTVFDRNQEQVESLTYSENDEFVAFELPFGTYFFVANTPDLEASQSTTVFVDQDGLLQLFIGTPNFTLTVEVSHNEEAASSVSITVLSSENSYFDTQMTDEEGNAAFNLPEGFYSVHTDYSGSKNQTSVSLYMPSRIRISLSTIVDAVILNATTLEPMSDVTLNLSDENDTMMDSAITPDNGTVHLRGKPGLAILTTSGNGFERIEQLVLRGDTELELTLGYATAIVNVMKRGEGPVDNATVEVKESGVVIDNSTTNSSGITQFKLLAGKTYEFHARSEELDEENICYVKLNQTMDIYISLGAQDLIVRVLDTATQEPVFGTEITIRNVNNPQETLTTVTNATGYGWVATGFGFYEIIATKDDVATLGGVLFSGGSTNDVTTLYLGNVSATLTTLDPNREAIAATITFSLQPELLDMTIQGEGPISTIQTYPGRYTVTANNPTLGYKFTGELELLEDVDLTLVLQRELLNLTLLSPANGSTVEGNCTLEFYISGSNGTLQYCWDDGINQTTSNSSIETPKPSGNHVLETILFGYEGAFLYKRYTFVIENPLPNITLLTPANDSSAPGGTEVQMTFSGSNGSYIYRWDSNENSSNPLGEFPRIPGTSGSHILQIWLVNFDQEWQAVTYNFTTANPSLNITLVSPMNGSFAPPGATVVFSVQGYNGTFLFNWNDGASNSTQEPFNTTLTMPNEPALHRLRVFVVDWEGNWTTAYYEFMAVYFLHLRIQNASTGLQLTEGQITISNSSQTIGPILLTTFPQEGLPLEPDNYTITLLIGDLNITNLVELAANVTITYSIGELTICLYDINTRTLVEQGYITLQSKVGELQNKTLTNGEVDLLVTTGLHNITMSVPSLNYSNTKTIAVLGDQRVDLYAGKAEISLHVRGHYITLGVSNATITVLEGDEEVCQMQTNSTGWTTLSLPQGAYRIIVNYSTSEEEYQVQVDASQELELMIQAKGTLDILVNDENGNPIAGAVVQLTDPSGIVLQAYTDVTGKVTFEGVNWGTITLQISHGEDGKIDTMQMCGDSFSQTTTVDTGGSQLPQQVDTGKWPGRRSYTVEDTKQQLRFYEKFLLSVVATAIALLIIVTALSLMGVFATVAHPLLDERYSMRVLRTLGATKQQTLGAISAELSLPATGVSLLASSLGLLVVSHVAFFQVVSVGGFLILPVTSPALPVITMFILGLMVAGLTYLQAQKAPEMNLASEERSINTETTLKEETDQC